MKKLSLELETLQVETFDTDAAISGDRGTVHGHYSRIGTCDARVGTCFYGGSCGPGCGTGTCTGIYCA